MIIKKQRGVALVQVLLITSMILILVVQLSKDARSQLRTSQINKDKVIALVNMKTAVEKTKYDLLSATQIEQQVFFGQTQTVNNTRVRIQDEAGLISLSYGVEQLSKFLGVETNDQKLVNLQRWQGLDVTSQSSSNEFKGGLIQYSKELGAVPGWQLGDLPEEVSTYLPTRFFNPLSSPEVVIRKFYDVQISEQIIEYRNSGDIKAAQKVISNFDVEAQLEASDVFRIQLEYDVAGEIISRFQKIKIDPNSQAVIQVLEY